MKKQVTLFYLLCSFVLVFIYQFSFSQSPCDPNGIHPFCTDDNPYGITYNSGTTGDASGFFGSSSYSCLYSMPAPAYYYMRIAVSGDILIHIQQVSTGGSLIDVDFACWGPFSAPNQSTFVNRLCSGQYHLDNVSSGSHAPSGGHHDPNDPSTWGGYPNGNVVDCSYSAAGTEWCYIPNGQVGEFYLLLLTNYSRTPGTITFSQIAGSANTDCSLLAGISYNGPLCEGETLFLTCDNYQPGATYHWSGPNNWSSNLQNPVIQNTTAAMAGTYTFTMVHQGETFIKNIVVEINPLPTINILPANPTICDGDSILLHASGAATYAWSTGHTTESVLLFPPQTETYIVTGTSNKGCTATASIMVKYGETLTYHLPERVCSGERVNVTPNLPFITYQWNTGETSSSIVPTVSVPTNYVVTITDTNGCIVKDSLMVYPTAIADFTADAFKKEMDEGEAIIYFADLSIGADNWFWNFGDIHYPGASSNDPSPIYSYTKPGLYNVCLIVSTNYNCLDTMCKRFFITTPFDFYIPNAFTPFRPNGLNDVFAPKGVGILPDNYEMIIYNRIGQIVFQTNELFGGWNGTLPSGEMAPLGTYVYRIALTDMGENEKIFYGKVTLIR